MTQSNVDLRNYVPLFGVAQSNVDLRNIKSDCNLTRALLRLERTMNLLCH